MGMRVFAWATSLAVVAGLACTAPTETGAGSSGQGAAPVEPGEGDAASGEAGNGGPPRTPDGGSSPDGGAQVETLRANVVDAYATDGTLLVTQVKVGPQASATYEIRKGAATPNAA